MSIKPVNPFGAGSSTLCRRLQRAGMRIHRSSIMASINNTITVLVRLMSNGRFSVPSSAISTIRFSYILPAGAIYSPVPSGHALYPFSLPSSIGSSSILSLMKKCHPVLLCTMTGKCMMIFFSPISVMCHS